MATGLISANETIAGRTKDVLCLCLVIIFVVLDTILILIAILLASKGAQLILVEVLFIALFD